MLNVKTIQEWNLLLQLDKICTSSLQKKVSFQMYLKSISKSRRMIRGCLMSLTILWWWLITVFDLQESLRQNQMTRYYLQQKEDPHGPSISLFVGNLPTGLSQRQYEKILLDIVGKRKHNLVNLCDKNKVKRPLLMMNWKT